MVCATSQGLLFVKREINVGTLGVASLHVEMLEVLNGFSLINQKSADHDGTCIDHGIVWSAKFVENWSIEYHTTGFLSNILVDIVTSSLLDIEIINVSICHDLADRLHRELAVVISKLTELAIR
jgi:hypothetical protein